METLTGDPGLPSRPREVLPVLSTDYLRVMRTWRTLLGHWVGECVPLGHWEPHRRGLGREIYWCVVAKGKETVNSLHVFIPFFFLIKRKQFYLGKNWLSVCLKLVVLLRSCSEEDNEVSFLHFQAHALQLCVSMHSFWCWGNTVPKHLPAMLNGLAHGHALLIPSEKSDSQCGEENAKGGRVSAVSNQNKCPSAEWAKTCEWEAELLSVPGCSKTAACGAIAAPSPTPWEEKSRKLSVPQRPPPRLRIGKQLDLLCAV